MAGQTSIRANTVPQQGVGQTAPVTGQGTSLFPSTQELLSAAEYFQEKSLHNCTQLQLGGLTPSQPTNYQINNIGLGESLELYITGSISFTETANAADITMTISPHAPYNILQSILVQMNGQTVIDSLSPMELVGVMAKRNKRFLRSSAAGAVFAQNLITVDPTAAWFSAGANCVLTAGNTLTGIGTAKITKNTTGIVNFGFYLEIPFVYNKRIPFGLLPLQNNSIYANVTLTANNFLGTTAYNPFYIAAGVPATFTNSANAITVKPTYNFWSIPSDAQALQLAQYFSSNVYMLLSQGNLPITKTGTQALQYNLQNNYIAAGFLVSVYDSTNAPIDVYSYIDNPLIDYNGTAIVDRRDMKTRMAKDNIYYEGAAAAAIGQYWHDFTNIGLHANSMNTSQMLNMYEASNPMLMADISASITNLPGYFSVLREQIVPANVQVIR